MESKVFGPGGGKGAETDKLNIDSIIARLLEGEIRVLCFFLFTIFEILIFFIVSSRVQARKERTANRT